MIAALTATEGWENLVGRFVLLDSDHSVLRGCRQSESFHDSIFPSTTFIGVVVCSHRLGKKTTAYNA